MIAIVDYGMGNLRSVSKALEFLGFEAVVTRDTGAIDSADKVILPGVGAFGAAMDNIKRYGLKDCIIRAATSGRPFLGICLGMQLLMESSEEQGRHWGLGVIPGGVIRFRQPSETVPETPAPKILNMGWCPVSIRKPSPLLRGVPDGSMVYFVHSYFVQPPADAVAGVTRHGIDYCSVIWQGNIHATQFHPEKSGGVGLRMLQNFGEAAAC